MGDDSDSCKPTGSYSSPPCLAAEIDPTYFDPLAVDQQQVLDVARWRSAERNRLRGAREALPLDERVRLSERLAFALGDLLCLLRTDGAEATVSFYWPIKNEPDLRPLMKQLYNEGVPIALPVVEVKASPLVFRRWSPRTRMVRGHWNIPVPPVSAPSVFPDIVLAPVVGWDRSGFRLGYGGGYFDRTLAAMTPRPFSIGIGLHAAKLETIFPQPHDIPLDVILTENGVEYARNPKLRP